MIRVLAVTGSDTMVFAEGWSSPEPGFTWSVGRESRIRIRLDQPADRLALDLTLAPYVHPELQPRQSLTISADGEVLWDRPLSARREFRFELAPGAGREGWLELRFCHPDAKAIPEPGGSDGRALGVQLFYVSRTGWNEADVAPAPAGPGRVTAYAFGCDDEGAGFLQDGWAAPAPDHVWANARQSRLTLPFAWLPQTETRLLLDMYPRCTPDHPMQRVMIGANGKLLGMVALTTRTTICFILPASFRDADALELTFNNLDIPAHGESADALAFMLCGVRLVARPACEPVPAAARDALGVLPDGSLLDAMRDATGEDPADLAARFLSLGNMCELGLLQRRLGREPNHLLRFAGVMTPHLLDNLWTGFSGLGRPDMLTLNVRPDEGRGFWVEDRLAHIFVQTPVSAHNTPPAALIRQLARVLPFLRRNFLEEIATGAPICVFHKRTPTIREEAEAVLAALSIWGDVHVLWVQPDDVRAGAAERLSARLLHGFVDRRAMFGHGSDESWLSMIANAWMLVRDARESRDIRAA